MTDRYPTLSLAERDRRWQNVRALLAREGLDGVVVFGNGRNVADSYLTNEARKSITLLTLDDDPVMFLGDVPLDHYDVPGARWERWVADWVAGDPIGNLATRVRLKGLAAARLGVVGLTSRAVGEWAGVISHTTWRRLDAALPTVRWADIADAYESLTIVFGEEEQTMLRKAAQLGERACTAFVEAAREGRNEHEIAAASFQAIIAGGGWVRSPFMLERAGASMFAWSVPEWFAMGGTPHVPQPGDTVAAEIFAFYGGIESQQQIDVSIGEPAPLLRELEKVCRDSYEAGLAALRPGMRFSELAAVMEAPLASSQTWNTGPMVQTVPPIYNSGTRLDPGVDPALSVLPQLPLGVPLDGDFVIEVGHAFAFEPNALRDGQRVCVGGTVLLSTDGVEELNTLPNHLVVV
ncbi:M24 family metallopeptidase [Microbacterium sp. SYP-A9085]|uniref:M24 family metallopeptidase n=1 Tax=Microbacterium sp. SYP-A9085 TaxID=2664454 RepID=UPI00129BBAD6|nr:M24 family metallopeptidase [Microbacterium sp. SYP-A9085]MRH29037.1 M24 family metallopeptidase [Microbacterium sp. SYP-A9085]